MTSLVDLYETAELNDIVVDCFSMKSELAISYMDEDGDCYIAIDPRKLRHESQEKVLLAHDLGHCMTGAFYNRYSPHNCIRKQERRACVWSYKALLPLRELLQAFENGITEYYELAECFELPECFIRSAVAYYKDAGMI